MTDPFDKLRTQRQTTILAYIRACDEAGDLPPTIREIMDETGITSSSLVSSDLDTLQREGYIKRLRDTSRGIRLTEKGHTRPQGGLAKPDEQPGAGGTNTRLADTIQVMQTQIADLQAEVVRLRHQLMGQQVSR